MTRSRGRPSPGGPCGRWGSGEGTGGRGGAGGRKGGLEARGAGGVHRSGAEAAELGPREGRGPEGRAQGEIQPGESRIRIRRERAGCREGCGQSCRRRGGRERAGEGKGGGELHLAVCLWPPPEEAEAEDGVHLGQFALVGSFLELVVLWSPLFLRPEPRARGGGGVARGGDLQLVLFAGQTGALSPTHSVPAAARPP